MCQLILHGDKEQVVPIGISTLLSFKIVKDITLRPAGMRRIVCARLLKISERGFARFFQYIRQGQNCQSLVSFGINIL
ncbi:hypothetical protein DU80_19965 [Methanosarcina mazei]|uniref:Uncharacterized protein n=1 Tax=Methanosarcina mazei TaxID=2209 RepID=A0A0F8HVF9_METMZ|nr:hypothetical protein DU47_14915 [Methanosarcina mazei]KKG06359.1 hypothetical protein DU40_15365 [Methanosarcina mazei]KKG07966.1 hypothetical protein DU31_19280 [Methanosarcina mazei]KKG13361.1 hypothetical protein DU34_06435 [Methanosarcina mazei]KKG26603.1 hypothetical protein DU52_17920 [Methanosarcina mazei]